MATARPLSSEETRLILAGLENPRDRLLVAAGIFTGLRITELLRLRIGDVATPARIKPEILVARRGLKGGAGMHRRAVKGRAIPVHPEFSKLLAAYIVHRPEGFPPAEEFLFKSRKGLNRPIDRRHAWTIVTEAARLAGIEVQRISTHSMRKTFAHEVYNASGHDILATKELLGHANIQTTVSYLENDQGRLRNLVMGMSFSAG